MPTVSASDVPWQAKWIAPSRITRPDVDFGAAQWVSSTGGAFRAEFALERVPDGPVEGVAIGTGSGCTVKVNGGTFVEPCGFVRDGTRLCRGDVARFLKAGTNVVEVKIENPVAGTPPSVLLAFRSGGRAFFVSGADWRTAEGASVRVEGAPRAVAWDGNFDYSVEIASPAFEKRFTVKGPVAAAKLRITAAGFYEARLDGVKIGDKVLDPPPTDPRRRILYSEYPVALTSGEHTLGILLGHGWYDMRTCATWNFDIAPWRQAPRTIAELTIRYRDGTVETVGTDREWRQVRSPVAYDDIREGEIAGAYDPRLPDFESRWVHPEEVPAPCARLERAELPGSKKVREVRPERIVKTGEGAWTVVFPETLAGWTRFTFRGARKGDVVTIRYDEHVGENFTPARNRILDCFFYRSGSCGILPGGAFQQDRVVASGAPEETFEPRFVYHGFQFVHLSGLRTEPKPEDIVAYEVRTAFEKTGSFVSSDENLNRLVALADASYRGNFVNGYPTDCPQREKLGWTADAALACPFAQYLYENTAAYRKWVVDICDAQRADGALPGIVPTGGWGFALYNGASWDYALAEVPWTVWEHRGDRRILEEAYPALIRYVKYEMKRCPGGLIDWGIMEDWHPIKTKTEPAYMCTAYFIRTANIALRMAEVLGRTDDRTLCAEAEAKSRAAFRKAFARGNGVFGPGGQTAQAVALNFGLVPEAEIPAARARLVEALRERDDHVDVGIQGFANLFEALSEMGRTDLAYRVLTRESSPSPLDWVKGGETTLGDYIRANAGSRNHVMYGTFVAWAFKYLAGISPAAPGYARVRIAPRPIPALSSVSATTQTPRGEIRMSWKTADGVFVLEVSVPDGLPSDVRLPDGTARQVNGGTHTFRCAWGGPVGKEKVLLDTDIGVDIDDAFALAYLLAEPRCELVGITTVGGHPELRAEMASAICTAFGKGDIPIHPGEDRALVYPREPLDPKAVRTLGDVPRKKFVNDGSAVTFMRKVIRENPGEITLVAVAPFTNIARLFQSDPEIPGLLKRMVVMGGRFFSEKPLPEWNIMCDPEATDAVFGPAAATNLSETTFFGLDVTLKTARPTDELLALCRKTKALNCLVGAMERYPEDHDYYRTHPKPLHDPLACVALFHPEVCTYRCGRARFAHSGGDQVTVRLEADTKGRQLAADMVDVTSFYRIIGGMTGKDDFP